MNIIELMEKYFQPLDEETPPFSIGNKVEHLIDGEEYFGAIAREIDLLLNDTSLKDKYFFQAGWRTYFGFKFNFDNLMSSPLNDSNYVKLLALMASKKVGVNVRIFPWASPEIMTDKKWWFGERFGFIGNNLELAYYMRQEGMADRVVLNTLNHPLGAMHMKVVLCGGFRSDAEEESGPYLVAFVSGLDIVPDRKDTSAHQADAKYRWHDAGVRIEGPAAAHIYNYFSVLWEYQHAKKVINFQAHITKGKSDIIPSHSNSPNNLAKLTIPRNYKPGTAAVQLLRTMPKYGRIKLPLYLQLNRYASTQANFINDLSEFRTPLPIAKKGLFEYATMVEHVFSKAQRYIYVEDSVCNSFAGLGWINESLKANSALKVIFVYGSDPADGTTPLTILAKGFADYLFPGIDNPADRIAFFRADIPIHSKVIIVDDEWATVGATNFTRRSFYTDGELSVAVLRADEGDSFARNLRKRLWGEHFLSSDAASNSISTALETVFAAGRNDLKPYIERMDVPFKFEESMTMEYIDIKLTKLTPTDLIAGHNTLYLTSPPSLNWLVFENKYIDVIITMENYKRHRAAYYVTAVNLDAKTLMITPPLPLSLRTVITVTEGERTISRYADTTEGEGTISRYSSPGKWFGKEPRFDELTYFFKNFDSRNNV